MVIATITPSQGRLNPVPESYRERAEATQRRFRLASAAATATPGTALSTAALLYHERGTGDPHEEHIRIALNVRMFISSIPNL